MLLNQNTGPKHFSGMITKNHSFYKESKIETASYQICALKYSLGASVSRDFLVIQLGPKLVLEKIFDPSLLKPFMHLSFIFLFMRMAKMVG